MIIIIMQIITAMLTTMTTTTTEMIINMPILLLFIIMKIHNCKITYMIHTNVLDVGSESLVEPDVRPPLGRHEVSEPLMGELMPHYLCNQLFVKGR